MIDFGVILKYYFGFSKEGIKCQLDCIFLFYLLSFYFVFLFLYIGISAMSGILLYVRHRSPQCDVMLFYIVVDLLTKQGSTRISTGSQIPPRLTPELEAMSRDNQMLTVDSRVAAMFLSTEHGALSDQRRWSLVLTLSL